MRAFSATKVVMHAEPPPNLTEIRGAARTTRSDPGRRKKQLAHRRDPNATKTAAGSQQQQDPELRASGASDPASRTSSAAPGVSTNDSRETLRGPAGHDTDYVGCDHDTKPAVAGTPGKRKNSRSALDLPGQVRLIQVHCRFVIMAVCTLQPA